MSKTNNKISNKPVTESDGVAEHKRKIAEKWNTGKGTFILVCPNQLSNDLRAKSHLDIKDVVSPSSNNATLSDNSDE